MAALLNLVQARLAPAEDTGLPAHAWDVVSAGQCWHWFDQPRVTAEARRLLVDGGPDDLAALFPMELIRQEVSTERYIEIPEEIHIDLTGLDHRRRPGPVVQLQTDLAVDGP